MFICGFISYMSVLTTKSINNMNIGFCSCSRPSVVCIMKTIDLGPAATLRVHPLLWYGMAMSSVD